MGLSSCLFVIDDETSAHLERVKVASQVLAAVKLFLVRMWQVFDGLLLLFFTLLLVCLVLDHSVFLALHPVDVLNLVLLHLEIVAGLPVIFTLLILQTVKLSELLFNVGDLIADQVSLRPGLVLLGIRLIEFFTKCVNFLVQFLFLSFDGLDFVPDLVLLTF